MDYLFEFAQRPEIREVVAAASENNGVQGVVIDFDPFWLSLWQLRGSVGGDDVISYLEALVFRSRGSTGFDSFGFGMYADYQRPDPSWQPPVWHEHSERLGFAPSPFVVRIVLKPGIAERPPFFETRAVRIIPETRPLAFLHRANERLVRPLVGGTFIGAVGSASTGTLGGVLEDRDGRRYGLTCSHVLPSGASVSQPPAARRRWQEQLAFWRASGETVGRCIASSGLVRAEGPCNPYHDDGSANLVDAALVEFDPRVPTALQLLDGGPLAGLAKKESLHPGMPVETFGMRSGHRRARLGGLCVFYTLRLGKAAYCFRNVVELRNRSRDYGVWGSLRRPTQPSDSGGWVTSAGSEGPEWCASIIGGDQVQGYAVLADFTWSWLEEAGYGELSVRENGSEL